MILRLISLSTRTDVLPLYVEFSFAFESSESTPISTDPVLIHIMLTRGGKVCPRGK